MRANNPIVTFHLEGELGKLYGSEFRFAARSIAHGLRSMCYQLKGDDKTDPFIDVLSKGYYSVIRNGREIDIEELDIALGKTRDVYIVPVPEGEGGGTGKLIFGVLLVAGAFLLAGPGGLAVGGLFLGGAAPTVSFGQIAAIGGLIAAAGAAQLLSPTPGAVDTRVREAPEERPSFLIDSLTNTTEEGAPVQIVHGQRILIGPHVISAGLDVEQTALEDLIETEFSFASIHTIGQGIRIDADGEFRGMYGQVVLEQFGPGVSAWPDGTFGSINPSLFRNKSVLSIMEIHLTSPPATGSQHALRVTLAGTTSRNDFTSIQIEQPIGNVVFIRLTEDVTEFSSRNLRMAEGFLLRGGVWEWEIGPGFTLDGMTDSRIIFGYDV